MEKEDLIQRSPIRIFDKSIHGGLKAGEIGVIAAPNGLGKTSVLVQIALYKLLQAQKVIHVSFTKHTDYILAWYEDIFGEFTKKRKLEHVDAVKNALVKNRVLMNFNQEGMTGEQILKSLRAMIVEGGFKAESLIVDGFDFGLTSAEHLKTVKQFAGELGLSVWYSCSVKSDASSGDKKIPAIIKDYLDSLDVVIALEQKATSIEFSVAKDRDVSNPAAMGTLHLDPKTLLIQE
jgi:hypothetical protein